jgi:hypothetical protein
MNSKVNIKDLAKLIQKQAGERGGNPHPERKLLLGAWGIISTAFPVQKGMSGHVM